MIEMTFPVRTPDFPNSILVEINKMTASRRIRTALQGGWLVNNETRPGYPYDLQLGDPLPDEEGLPRPKSLKVTL